MVTVPTPTSSIGNDLPMKDLLSDGTLRDAVDLLVRLVEAVGALIIFSGAAVGFFGFLTALVRRRTMSGFAEVRVRLGRYLALGLEFQLAADILRTAVAPSFEEIGQLAAVAAIRTALNGTVALDANEHNSGGHRWALDVPKLGHSPSSRAPGAPRSALEAVWPSSTQQCPCKPCGTVITADNEEELVARVQTHAAAHDGAPALSREHILAHMNGDDPEED